MEVEAALVGAVAGGRYRVTRLVHHGGVGDVFAAYDEQEREEVALKVLSPGWAADATAASRILKDVSTLAALEIPAIVETRATGRLEDGRPYIATELLEGADLRSVLSRQSVRLFPEEAAHLLSGIAAALDAAHATGVVHRALTPAKVFLVRSGPGARVRLLGCGMGSLLAPQTDAARPTREMSAYGDVAYLAPDVDDPGGGDGPTDVYALAVMAFELLAGAVPFQGGNDVALLAEKRASPPMRLREVSGIPFPAAVEEVLENALALERARRYRTAGELLTDLVRAAHGIDVRGATTTARLTQTKVLDVVRATSETEMVDFLLSPFGAIERDTQETAAPNGLVHDARLVRSSPPADASDRSQRVKTLQGMPSTTAAPTVPVAPALVADPAPAAQQPAVPNASAPAPSEPSAPPSDETAGRERRQAATFDLAHVREAGARMADLDAAATGEAPHAPSGWRRLLVGFACLLLVVAAVIAITVAR